MVNGLRRLSVQSYRHFYAFGGVVAGLNLVALALGAAPVALVVDAAAVVILALPAVAVALGVGKQTVDHGRKVAQTARDLAQAPADQRRAEVTARWRAYRSDELRAVRVKWRGLVESDGKFPAGCRVTGLSHEARGRVLHVSRPHRDTAELRKWEGAIAGWFAAGRAEVVVANGVGGNAARCVIRLHERDPFAKLPKRRVWDGYGEITRTRGGHSGLDPMPVGLGEDGQIVTIQVTPGRHHRVTGASGSGKGNYVLCELMWLLWSRDTWCYVLDFEGGADFARLERCCRGYANTAIGDGQSKRTPDQVLDLAISDALARAPELIRTGRKRVKISPTTPMLHLLVDGAHRLTKPQWEKVHRFAAEMRKYGGHLTLLDQIGTAKKNDDNSSRVMHLCPGTVTFSSVDRVAFSQSARREPQPGELDLPQGRAILVGFWGKAGDPGRMAQTGWAGDGDPGDPYAVWSKALPSFTQKWPTATSTRPGGQPGGQPSPPLTTPDQSTEHPPTLSPTKMATPSPGGQPVKYTPGDDLTAWIWGTLCDAPGWVDQAAIINGSPASRNTVKARLRAMHTANVIERRDATAAGRTYWRAMTVAKARALQADLEAEACEQEYLDDQARVIPLRRPS